MAERHDLSLSHDRRRRSIWVGQTDTAALEMNKIYRTEGKTVAEVDVRAIARNRLGRFIECKGLLPGNSVDDDDVYAWLNRRIPLVRTKTLENPELQNIKFKFEMWLTGKLSEKAQAMVSAAQAQAGKKYTIDVYGPEKIEDIVKNECDDNLLKILRDHFLRAPLAIPDEFGNEVSKRRITLFEKHASAFGDLTIHDGVAVPGAAPATAGSPRPQGPTP